MNKKLIITLSIIVLVVFGYYVVIKNFITEEAKYDRTVLLMNYDGKNYFGSFNVKNHQIYGIELDDRLTFDNKATFGDFTTSEEFTHYLSKTLNYEIDDIIEYDDNNQVISTTMDDETKAYYNEMFEYQQYVTKMLDDNPQMYHPKYNNVLVRIGKAAQEKDESLELIVDGVMDKSVVRKMIKADIDQETINSAFIQTVEPALTCESADMCTIIEPYYAQIASIYNANTKHKLPEYSEINKNED